MATFNKFDTFVEYLGEGGIDFSSDTIKVMLTDTAPVETNSTLSDITEITAENGYTAGGEDVSAAFSEADGVASVSGSDVTWTASGGTVGPFRYIVLYDDTNTDDALIGWWDYGSDVTLADGETFTVDFDDILLTME